MKRKQQPDFFMCNPKPHRVRSGYRGALVNTKLFKVTFCGPVLPDTDDGMPCWFQTSAIVPNYKAAVVAFNEWVEETKEYIGAKAH